MDNGVLVVGDIGGTNVRFASAAIVDGRPVLAEPWIRPADGFADFYAAFAAFLSEQGLSPRAASFGLAGPVEQGVVHITNRPWTIASSELSARFGLRDVLLANDFALMARVAGELEGEEVATLSDRPGRPGDPLVIAGPGTGFGLGFLSLTRFGPMVSGGEGGHQLFSPQTEEEWQVFRLLHARFGYVPVELVAAGVGYPHTLAAMQQVHGRDQVFIPPGDLIRDAEAGDAFAGAVCALRANATMGALGDGVLAMGARRGAFLAGGVATRLERWFRAPEAMARFYTRGIQDDYMAVTPVRLIRAGDAALKGAAWLYIDHLARA